MNSHETFSLEDLAQHLGLDRRRLEKLANRGRLPGRKVGGEWQFQQAEITQWLEQEMREYTDQELQTVENSHGSLELSDELPVTSLMHPDTVEVPLQGKTKRSVLEGLVEVAGRTWQLWEPATVLKAVQDREATFSTAYRGGIAVPHPRNPLPEAIGESLLAFGRTSSGIPFGAPDGQLTDLFFLLICKDSRTHLKVLARLGRMFQLPGFAQELRECEDSLTTYHFLKRTDERLKL